MRILIAEDDMVSRRVLDATLVKWGHQVVVTNDGDAALAVLQGADAPSLAILNWMMPGMMLITHLRLAFPSRCARHTCGTQS